MFRIWKIVICPKTKANEDKILKITKEPNRVIGDYSRPHVVLSRVNFPKVGILNVY